MPRARARLTTRPTTAGSISSRSRRTRRVAVIASEDQLFPFHAGFDFKSIREAVRATKPRPAGGRTSAARARSRSRWPRTCSCGGRQLPAQGARGVLHAAHRAQWPKERILEVYLNIAQFGDGIYGVEAAAQRFWRKPAARLDRCGGGDAGGGAAEPDAPARQCAVAVCSIATRPDPGADARPRRARPISTSSTTPPHRPGRKTSLTVNRSAVATEDGRGAGHPDPAGVSLAAKGRHRKRPGRTT